MRAATRFTCRRPRGMRPSRTRLGALLQAPLYHGHFGRGNECYTPRGVPHGTKERSRQVYIIVAGGGKVGHYLTKTLLLEGHEVLVIEIDPRKASRIEEELGEVVLQGDACEATTLEGAGAQRADVVIAVTGADERNLVTCQLAKRKFGVGRT